MRGARAALLSRVVHRTVVALRRRTAARVRRFLFGASGCSLRSGLALCRRRAVGRQAFRSIDRRRGFLRPEHTAVILTQFWIRCLSAIFAGVERAVGGCRD